MMTITNVQFLKEFKELTVQMHTVAVDKNADYASGISNTDPLANFTLVEKMGVTATETGFLTRMCDKFSRITTFVNKGVLQVKNESVEDTLIDLANYCLLLVIFIRNKRRDADKVPELNIKP